ncbi:hypothetical protein T8K17_11385 [Thalassobaculum sp. OXR-137]|uniref:hypothetical protein n=1 Tax=Thalassobaculum sp. OXR-137 TaxID=3100173 RepID=UPI002AC8AA86|nr:hypothetical protein [Thalassobaculum sp. OXR-137]WPZ36737.1 hypothetical protein T8K17_11385 [Thalassobaculum sp. OXR-137]
MKMFKATLTTEFPYDGISSPLALAAQIEAALASGKKMIEDEIVALHPDAAKIVTTLDTGIVNVRPKKAETQPPVEPLHDPSQTDLKDAVNAAAAGEAQEVPAAE